MIPFTNLRLQYESIRKEILDATDMVLKTGVLMNGPYTQSLEEQIARRLDMDKVICVGSGTQALEMIARFHYESFYGVTTNQPTVVVPALTYPATINAFITTGWNVIIGDVNPKTGILDMDKIKQPFDAVCVVGLYGHPVFDDWYLRRKEGHNKLDGKIIIEDAAQHWLASDYSQRPIMKAISFDPTKNLPNYGNGGAIATWDEYTDNWFRMYRDNGKPHTNSYGTNSRMSEVDAAQMLVKLKYIDSWQDRRYEIAEYYIQRFKDEAPRIRTFMSDMLNRRMHGLQKFVIEIDKRDKIKDLLYLDGIECKVHYERPLHEMEPYEGYEGPNIINNASALARRVLSLPFYPELTDADIKYVADRVIHHVETETLNSTRPSRN